MQKQKTRPKKPEETTQTESRGRESKVDNEALDKLLDEINAGIDEEEERQNEELRRAFIEKARSIQTQRRGPCWCGGLVGDYEYEASAY